MEIETPMHFWAAMRSAPYSGASRNACRILCWALVLALMSGGAIFPLPSHGQFAGPEDSLAEERVQFDAKAVVVALPVTVNSRQLQFVLDTGATLSVIDSSLRGDLGAPVRSASAETTVGTTDVEIFRAPSAKLGGRVLSGVTEVACADLSGLRRASGADIRGVIGMDFLQHRIVRIDFDRGEFLCLRGVPNDAGEAFPLKWRPQGRMVVLTVAGEGEITFALDTGCGVDGNLESGLFKRLMERGVAVHALTQPTETGSGHRDRRGALVAEISLNGFRHRGLFFLEGNSNLLGLGYLSRYVVTIDFPSKKLYLKPGARFNEPSHWNLSGLHATRVDDVTSIVIVAIGSVAEKAGLKPGDVILQIDGQPASSITLAEVQRAFGREGKRTLRVSRGGKTREIVLDLKEPPGIRAALEAGRTVVVPEARGVKRDRN